MNYYRLHIYTTISGVLSLVTEAIQNETLVSMSLFGRVYSEVNLDIDNFLPLFCNYFRILIILTSFVLPLNQKLVFKKIYCSVKSKNNLF